MNYVQAGELQTNIYTGTVPDHSVHTHKCKKEEKREFERRETKATEPRTIYVEEGMKNKERKKKSLSVECKI